MGGLVSKENVRRFEADPLLLSLLTVETKVGGFEPLKWSPVTVKLSMLTFKKQEIHLKELTNTHVNQKVTGSRPLTELKVDCAQGKFQDTSLDEVRLKLQASKWKDSGQTPRPYLLLPQLDPHLSP